MTGLRDIWQNRAAILEGISNKIFPKEEVELIAMERINICRRCEYDSINAHSRGYKSARIDEHCVQCGCPLSTKTRALSKGCPIGKWGAVISDKEEHALDIITKDNENKVSNDNQEHIAEGSL